MSVEVSAEGPLRGQAASRAWPLVPLRESSRRNAALPEYLVVNTDVQGRAAAGEEEMDSPYGAAPGLARPEHTRRWFLN